MVVGIVLVGLVLRAITVGSAAGAEAAVVSAIVKNNSQY